MAKYDYGGGCPCGLYRECIEQCEHYVVTNPLPRMVIEENKMEDDFGFSIVDENDLTVVVENTDKVRELRDMIMPLLQNLKANPDKDINKWKGSERVQKIDAFIKKINKLVDG